MKNRLVKNNGRTNKYITSLPLLLLCMPVIIFLIMFHYVPIFGVIIAFQDFNYTDCFSSPWVGLENFKFFFQSNDAAKVIFNTIGYHLWMTVLSMFFGILIALLFYEIDSRRQLKYFQTIMALPNVLSWVIVAYIVYAMLSFDNGLINTAIEFFGGNKISWYNETKYWFGILSFTHVWQSVGMGCLIYYSSLMGIDQQLFEAAKLDGAGKLKQIWHISLPAIKPIISIMAIMSMGGIMGSNLGLFYQVPMDSATLYPVTDVMSTYLLRGLKTGKMGVTAAVGLFQSLTGAILLITTNTIVKKVNSESSMF